MSSEISNEMSIENKNLEIENEDFLEKLNEYYKLKNDYETKKQVVKNNILKDETLTMKQKQEKFGKHKFLAKSGDHETLLNVYDAWVQFEDP